MSFFGTKPGAGRFLLDRGIILVAVAMAALLWAGLVPAASTWVWQMDAQLRDELSLFLAPTREREDLVFLGIDAESRKQATISPADRKASRALTMMFQEGGNENLDRRVFAEVIHRLADAGARQIIFDVVFVGSTGSTEADREFAAALRKHHERVILASILVPGKDGTYHHVDPLREVPGLGPPNEGLPATGYVNLWPDADNDVIRHMIFQVTRSELEGRPAEAGEPVYEALAATSARLQNLRVPGHDPIRIRWAVSNRIHGSQSTGRFADAYAPQGLFNIFIPERWENDYQGGAYFRDKVVLISTSTFADDDLHHIPAAIVHGGQIHLQALGCLLEDSFWTDAPRWAEVLLLLLMAGVGTILVHGLRNLAVLALTMLAAVGVLVIASAAFSGLTGILFAGTPGVLGLVAATVSGAAARTLAGSRPR